MFYLEFLAKAHEILQPRGYLEIGVRHGDSLRLAQCAAIGIDPAPILANRQRPNETIYHDTSNAFFSSVADRMISATGFDVDLAFIDGMHLIEYALRDFINVEKYANESTLVIFDDVLPYNQAIAAREQPPGDWTGDVWKMIPLIRDLRPDLAYRIVDTQPTGLLLVWGLDPANSTMDTHFEDIIAGVRDSETVPDYILARDASTPAVSPEEALDWLRWPISKTRMP